MEGKKYKVKNMKVTEGWNINNLKYWIKQPYESWIETFGKGDEKSHNMSDKEWINWIKRELIQIVGEGNPIRLVTYGYTKKNQAGRIYSKSFSLQNISASMRPYFYREQYHEVDISNCFPTLTYYLFTNARDGPDKKPVTRLEWYLKNRQAAHTKWDIDKSTFNAFLNRDNPDWSGGWHHEFRKTIEQVHDRRNQYALRNSEFMDLVQKKKRQGKSNPFASAMFDKLERMEEKIRNKMISVLTDEDTNNRHDMVIQHDGLHLTYPVTEDHIDEINNWLFFTEKKPLLRVSWKPASLFYFKELPSG